jgi:hypothetical protein
MRGNIQSTHCILGHDVVDNLEENIKLNLILVTGICPRDEYHESSGKWRSGRSNWGLMTRVLRARVKSSPQHTATIR